ncbi:hypothetical protein V9T40_004732 [Parthenolecanium corni]|uniref:Uncharacterized protein n=1 Tax=Parthenolecanium corni TaxID=536013 RepID=A0AAN9TGJ4_9HEMI
MPGPIFHKKKDTRPKELKIIHVNGSNIAEINDLKNLPMSVIFKIFVEKFEDTSRHCTVYVCKFGLRNGCNTKFMDVKENRIHRLEHLIQCHLLEHLLKTKSGSFIEIPKRSFETMKTNTSSNSMTEVDHSKNINDISSRSNAIAVKKAERGSHVAQKRSIRKNIRPNNEEGQTVVALNELATFDHTYAVCDEKKSINSTNSSEEYHLIKNNDVNINELFLPNGECSEELSSFMIMKATKRKFISNEDERSTSDTKAGKIIQMPQTPMDVNNTWFVDLKENLKVNVSFAERNEASILKTALTKNQAGKRPIINISNVWNNIHVQYV